MGSRRFLELDDEPEGLSRSLLAPQLLQEPYDTWVVAGWGDKVPFADGLPSVPVFDKTLPVKQMHVLEPLDLLILRADKGACPSTRLPKTDPSAWGPELTCPLKRE